MGDCLILRRGGEPYELPILNTSYPADVSVVASASGSATFKVMIAIDGKPAEYTYQWYKDGSAVSGATSSSYTATGLTSADEHTVFCQVANKAGSVSSRAATLSVTSYLPTYSYNGTAQLIDDGNFNWRLKFLTSGTLRFSYLGNGTNGIDVFCVGGGGGGGWGYRNDNNEGSAGTGGGGGYATTSTGKSIAVNTDYTITIGAGGSSHPATATPTKSTGGTTSAFSVTAAGGQVGGPNGYCATDSYGGVTGWGKGGSGGGSGRTGGKGGFNGSDGSGNSSSGAGTSTYEFGDTSSTLYCGGGGGGYAWDAGAYGTGGSGGGANGATGGKTTGSSASANTGGGGGGGGNSGYSGGSGGSGIVVIRNKR